MMNHYEIKYVAKYLRKSRGDEDKDLANHRLMLSDICKENGWKFVEYCEIGTSDSIELRPKFQQLLREVEDGLYDAVLVVDYDRLGRGSSSDQETIQNAFKESQTLVITPQKVYDLNNDTDETYAEFHGFLARQEYKMIKKRLARGKKFGSRRGNWTNGTPPFPYEYERWGNKYNEKGLVVNDEKLIVYREIIDMALKGYTLNEIRVHLNEKGILSPRGSHWHNNTVRRLLLDETHLGKIISNKGKGDSHATKKTNAKPYQSLPKSEWIIVENCHEALKTQEEHDKIILSINARNLIGTKARARSYSLSGVLKCGVCGRGVTFTYNKKYDRYYIKPCWYVDPLGNKCTNKGANYKEVEDKIIELLLEYKEELEWNIEQNLNNVDTTNIENQISVKQNELKKYRQALTNLNDAYDIGDYTRDEWKTRKERWQNKIANVENEIDLLEKELDSHSHDNIEDTIELVEQVINIMNNVDVSQKDKNIALKLVIKRVVWSNNDGMLADIKLEFQ